MMYSETPLTEEQAKILALQHELNTLRGRHETLGAAYRAACEKLEKQHGELEELKRRLAAISDLCERAL